MDYVRRFDIELEKDVYYAGEKLAGRVIVENTENMKVQGIRLMVRGKAHAEWKINKAGERRTVKQDEYYIDEKKVIWGKDKNEEGSVPILPRGNHKYSFQFQLPETALPCSFESKMATIRYYLRVIVDMPYASSPQGIKYFTIIGPHTDCMDERYLAPTHAQDKRNSCCLCCGAGPLVLKATLDRSAYCCGESVQLRAEVQNGSDEKVWVVCRLMQYVEYFINKGVLGLNKELSHRVCEIQGSTVPPHRTVKVDDLHDNLQLPVMPPTLINVCSNVEIYYVLKVFLHMEKTGDVLHIEFPLTVGTLPFRIPTKPAPEIKYDIASNRVEGGIYISSEFQFGQVYMGEEDTDGDDVILYRPVYLYVPRRKDASKEKEKDPGMQDDDSKEVASDLLPAKLDKVSEESTSVAEGKEADSKV